jgi:transcriptional regulator with XRE-family HTH domain
LANDIARSRKKFEPGEFDRLVKTQLVNRKWTHAELARRLGIKQTSLSRYLSGVRRPSTRTILAIAQAFELSSDEHTALLEAAGYGRIPGISPRDPVDQVTANLLAPFGRRNSPVGLALQRESSYDPTDRRATVAHITAILEIMADDAAVSDEVFASLATFILTGLEATLRTVQPS